MASSTTAARLLLEPFERLGARAVGESFALLKQAMKASFLVLVAFFPLLYSLAAERDRSNIGFTDIAAPTKHLAPVSMAIDQQYPGCASRSLQSLQAGQAGNLMFSVAYIWWQRAARVAQRPPGDARTTADKRST